MDEKEKIFITGAVSLLVGLLWYAFHNYAVYTKCMDNALTSKEMILCEADYLRGYKKEKDR